MRVTPARNISLNLSIVICITALLCMIINANAASLFGDFSCKSWDSLEYQRKKEWANAFLAPLSLTYQGLKKTEADKYNDDANSYAPAIASIDQFCRAYPDQSPADGAAVYLNTLMER